jgi:hypothetical protein
MGELQEINVLTTPFNQIFELWDSLVDGGRNVDMIKALALEDRYFLLVQLCGRKDMLHEWLYDRCREVEQHPDGYLDLWAREHYKSTIITFGGVIQEILRDPEITIGLFSHTAPIAKAFLNQIRGELERNTTLKKLFPEILYENPRSQSPSWSLDKGILVKRHTNPKEATVEASGLVDGQPTSKHFKLMVYDDVVVKESVSTPEQIKKTTEAWETSDNLGSHGGRKWHIGTRWSFGDTYETIINKGVVEVRLYPATHDGTLDGQPVFLTKEQNDAKKIIQGPAVYACHCAGTLVLMGDWTYKPIEQVRVGDEVVGFETGIGKGNKMTLVKTRVVCAKSRITEAKEYILKSGQSVKCTPGHKWWTKRSDNFETGRKAYRSFEDGLTRLVKLTNLPERNLNPEWQYLAGILDGEGSYGGGRIEIYQSHTHNPEVTQRIHQTLNNLGLDYVSRIRSAHVGSDGTNHRESTMFLINGGRHERHRILLNCHPAKKQKLIDSLYCTIGGKSKGEFDPLIKVNDLGQQEVFNIQTGTGNYIANGYASKNCQMLQNPLGGKERMFDIQDLQTYELRPGTLSVYVMCDPARSKKRGSAKTAIVVIGVDHGMNKYLLDGFNHRMDLKERWEHFSLMYKRWTRMPGVQNVRMGYESFGAQADMDYFEEQMKKAGQPRFEIVLLEWPHDGEGSKIDRVQRLGPDLRSHKLYIPHHTDPKSMTRNQRQAVAEGLTYRLAQPIIRKCEEGKKYDLSEEFKMQLHYFPYGGFKDLVDAASRIYDMSPKPPVLNESSYLEPEHP